MCVGGGGQSLSRLHLLVPPCGDPWAVFFCNFSSIPAKANKPQLVFVWSGPESNCGSLSLCLQPKESTCSALESD